MTKEKENELIEQMTKIGLYLAEVQAENRILKDINDKLMQALRIYNVGNSCRTVSKKETVDDFSQNTNKKW